MCQDVRFHDVRSSAVMKDLKLDARVCVCVQKRERQVGFLRLQISIIRHVLARRFL